MDIPEHVLDLVVALTTDPHDIPQLAVLHLPWRMPGEPESWPSTDWRATGVFPGVWTIDTVYVGEDDVDDHLAAARRAEQDQQAFSLRHRFTHEGTELEVQTDYCGGFDFNTREPGHPPLIFETMIFALDGEEPGMRRCWRYATRAAAVNGHTQIVAALS